MDVHHLNTQHRLRQQVKEAEAEAAVSQDWVLNMLAAKVTADQICHLQQRMHHQLMEARAEAAVSQVGGQMKEGEAEAKERHNDV